MAMSTMEPVEAVLIARRIFVCPPGGNFELVDIKAKGCQRADRVGKFSILRKRIGGVIRGAEHRQHCFIDQSLLIFCDRCSSILLNLDLNQVRPEVGFFLLTPAECQRIQ